MEPLTEIQLLELDEISKLPKDQQQYRIREFFSKLKPEQIEWLKSQQHETSGIQCPFCLITKGKIKARVVYDLDNIIAVLDINPASKGHIIVFPKEHIKDCFEMQTELFLNLINIVNKIAIRIKKVVNANGVNILLSIGSAAGQKVDHFLVHVIPRFNNDNINFNWENQKISEEELSGIMESFKDFYVESFNEGEKVNLIEEIPKAVEQQNYFYVKEEDRIP